MARLWCTLLLILATGEELQTAHGKVSNGEVGTVEDQQDGKIVNGTLAAQGEFPYAVSKSKE